jgi:tRNA threonylcarbamoyl adenosine modification protein (Sua5/YciO/YrdC/YwlC family)
MLIEINPENPQGRKINRVLELLNDGGVIVYPTDTYYGMGCDITNVKAIKRIYQLKQRDHSQPFSFICADLKNISDYAKVTNYAYKTMKRLLPGPYTFVLEGSKQVPKQMLTKQKTVGIRVPDHKIALELVKAMGRPIISTTVTLPDGTVMHDASLIHERFGDRVDCVIDGGAVPNEPSSIISLLEETPEIIREGRGDVAEFRV